MELFLFGSGVLVGFVIDEMIRCNVEYRQKLKSMTPEELAIFKEEERYEGSLW